MKQKQVYILIAIGVAILFFGGIISQSNQIGGKPKETTQEVDNQNVVNEENSELSKEEVANMTMEFINSRILNPQGVTGTLEKVEELGENLYVIVLKVQSGQQAQFFSVYATRDGRVILPNQDGIVVIDLKSELQQPTEESNRTYERVTLSADDDPCIGPDNAPVVVIEFSDFQCPFCSGVAGYNEGITSRMKSRDPNWEPPVPKLKELAKEGKIRFVYRDFPLSSIHAQAQKAAEAAQCAYDQGKFWEMHDKLFQGQQEWSGNEDAVSIFKRYASELALNMVQFNECLDSGKYESEVMKDYQDGLKAGVSGTPTFFVNGIPVRGAVSFEVIEQLIKSETAGKGSAQTKTFESCGQ
jgi:protein-disulfide isomerase